MKKLKVTWQDGSWSHDGVQPAATQLLHAATAVSLLGETLVFKDTGRGAILLVVPEGRLISVVQVEVGTPDA